MKRLLLLLFIGFIVAGYIFSGPFRTLWGIHAAVEAKNEAQLERHIDFPAVRESLKGQIEAKIQREVAQQRDNLMMYALVSQLAPQATNSLVDEFLNMESIGTLMQTAKKHHEANARNQAEGMGEGLALDISIRESIELILAVFEFSYKDWNSFEIKVHEPISEFSEAKIIFERSGLDWPIVAIELPDTFWLWMRSIF